MGRPMAPGPVHVGRVRRWLHRHAAWLGLVYWLALEPRKNQPKRKRNKVKSQGRKNSVKSRGGLFGGGGGKKEKKSGWLG